MADTKQNFADLNHIEFTEIKNFNEIGRGSFGTVFKAEWKCQDIAIKTFDNNNFGPDDIREEIKQLSRVGHQNIIALYGVAFNHGRTCLVMEYAECGSLQQFLHGKEKSYYSISHAMSWARQCSEAVAYLHNMKPKPLIHRDLKPPNLLLANRYRDLKICDFGTAVDQKTMMTNNKGSAAWMAPEVFELVKYNEKCDVFSWAIILWQMLSREKPFKEFTNTHAIQWNVHKGKRPPLIRNCPKPIEKLMTTCWDPSPEKRPPMQYVTGIMTELCRFFPGADIPLEKGKGGNSQTDQKSFFDQDITGSNTILDSHLLNLKFPNEVTPTNSGNLLNTSDFSEMTSSDENSKTPVNDPFRLTPSADTEKRMELIRREMEQHSGKPMPMLKPLDLDPNAWELNDDERFREKILNGSKSDGKDRLTVREAKPVSLPGDDDIDDTDATEDASLTSMLDKDLQPEPPIKNNRRSQEIHQDHIKLTKQYLTLNTERVYANQQLQNILENMSPEERQKRIEIIKKRKEKAELLAIYKNLKDQLTAKTTFQPGLNQQNHQSLPTGNGSGQSLPGTPSSENSGRSDDGWVIIQQNQNNNHQQS